VWTQNQLQNPTALDASTGARIDWDSQSKGDVFALAARGPRIYVGGKFPSLAGQATPNLTAIDEATGGPTGWAPAPNGRVHAIVPGDSLVWVGGEFTEVGGQARNRIAAVDVATGVPTSLDPGADGPVKALCANGGTIYAGGDFSMMGGQIRARIAEVDASTGAVTSWDPNANATVYSVARLGSIVYAGGTFTHIGGASRNYFAALDASSGHATAWDPAANSWVLAQRTRGAETYAGGGFRTLGGRSVTGIARILPAPAAPPQVRLIWPNGGTVPMGASVRLTWSADAPAPGVESVDLWLSRSGPSGPWTLIEAGAPNTGEYQWLVPDTLPAANCAIRVNARDYAGNVASDLNDAPFDIGSTSLAAPEPPASPGMLARLAPNPIRSIGRIELTVRSTTHVRLSVCDVSGREVRILVNDVLPAGSYSRSLEPRELPPGLYFLRARQGTLAQSQRFVVVR